MSSSARFAAAPRHSRSLSPSRFSRTAVSLYSYVSLTVQQTGADPYYTRTGIPELEKLMGDLTLFNNDNANAGPAGFVPRSGELVSAKFSADDAWYRAKVRRSHPGKKEAEVLYIDCASRLWTSRCVILQTYVFPTRRRRQHRNSAVLAPPSSPCRVQGSRGPGQGRHAQLCLAARLADGVRR